jgi:hypothetical protein
LFFIPAFHRRSFCGAVSAWTSSTNDDPSVTNISSNSRPSNKTAKHTHNDKEFLPDASARYWHNILGVEAGELWHRKQELEEDKKKPSSKEKCSVNR